MCRDSSMDSGLRRLAVARFAYSYHELIIAFRTFLHSSRPLRPWSRSNFASVSGVIRFWMFNRTLPASEPICFQLSTPRKTFTILTAPLQYRVQ